jgi:hypothetical protein
MAIGDEPKYIKRNLDAFPFISLDIFVDIYFTSVVLTLKRGDFILYKELLEDNFDSDLSLNKPLIKNIANGISLMLQKEDKKMAVAYAYTLLSDASIELNEYYKKYLKEQR